MVRAKIIHPTTSAGYKKYHKKSWKWTYHEKIPFKKEKEKKLKKLLKQFSKQKPIFREGAWRSPDGRYYGRLRTATIRDTKTGRIHGKEIGKKYPEVTEKHVYDADYLFR